MIRTIRNILGGLLAGYGFAAFICSIVVLQVWEMHAPRQPDEALGLIYLHQEKSVRMYFSRIQSAIDELLFANAIAIFAGMVLLPWAKGASAKYSSVLDKFHWRDGHPDRAARQSAYCGMLAAAIFYTSLLVRS